MSLQKALDKELARLEKDKPEVIALYGRAHKLFKEITTAATGEAEGSKIWTGFYNAAIWEFLHHVLIVERSSRKVPDLEKG